MPDYNLGKAHGTIRIDYDKSGAEDAREDIEKVGEEADKSGEKIDKSTKNSKEDYEALAQSAKKASESLNFDNTSAEQMAATVKKLEQDVTSASTAAYAARARLQAAEENLAAVRERSGATAKEVADAEKAVRSAQQQTITSSQRLGQNTKALTVARERLNRIPKPPDPTPDVDNNVLQQFVKNLQRIEANTAKSSSGLNTFTGRTKVMIGGVAAATPAIAGLAVSLASLVGVAGVAAGALAALGATGATVATGLSGVGDAFKAAGAQAKSAGSSAAASAKAQKAAARAIEDAKRSLADAEENLRRTQEEAARSVLQAIKQVAAAQRDLVDAQRDAQRAQEDLNQARRQAIRDLEDMQFALTGGSLDERQAILDVKKAQEDLNKVLADPTANADDIEQATINLEKQKLALDEARKANERLAVDSTAAAAAGVAGSDAVVNAQDGVRSATQGVADAQQSLADAQDNVRQVQVDASRQIADAVQGVIDAQRNLSEAYEDAADSGAAGGAAADKFAESMAKLSPNARAFVSEVLSLSDAWDEVKRSVQDKLFAGLAEDVKPLAQDWLPLLEEGMGKVATGLNGIVKETLAYLKTTEAQENVANIFDNTGAALTNLRGVVRDLLAAFLDIASVGSDFLPSMATDAANAATRFREFISAAKESGKLREWMQDGMDAASQLWQLLKNLGSIIGTVFSAFDQEGGGALNTLTKLTGAIDKFLKSAEGQEALHALGRILASIGGAYGKVFLSFLDAAASILVALEPFIVAFADSVGVYLAGAIQVVLPVVQFFADIIGAIGPALGPVIAGIYAANKAIAAAKIVWLGLNVVMDANPFLLIAAAVITLALLIYQNWDSIVAFLSGVWEWISSTASSIWGGIGDFFTNFWAEITGDFTQTWNEITGFLSNTWTSIWNAIKTFWNNIGEFFSGLGREIVDDFSETFHQVVDFFRRLPGQILDFVKGLPSKFLSLGADILSGILRGLGNLGSALIRKFTDAISSAWDSVLDFFGISSPSKLAEEAGQYIVLGLAQGIDRTADAAVTAAANMAAAVGEELTGASGTLATQVDMAAKGTGLDNTFEASGALALPASATPSVRGGDGASAGRMVNIERVDVYVQGNLDPTNPTAFRRTMVRLKTELRNLDKEYA